VEVVRVVVYLATTLEIVSRYSVLRRCSSVRSLYGGLFHLRRLSKRVENGDGLVRPVARRRGRFGRYALRLIRCIGDLRFDKHQKRSKCHNGHFVNLRVTLLSLLLRCLVILCVDGRGEVGDRSRRFGLARLPPYLYSLCQRYIPSPVRSSLWLNRLNGHTLLFLKRSAAYQAFSLHNKSLHHSTRRQTKKVLILP